MSSSHLKYVGKLAATGGTIAAIAFGFLAFNPSTEGLKTNDAEADITDFTLTTLDDTRRFTSAVNSMGMKPRAFDVNGNTMYFASGTFKMKPLDILDRSQELFVEAGINEKNHAKTVPIRQKARGINWDAIGDDVDKQMAAFDTFKPGADAVMSGDVVPTEISADYVEMVGMKLDYEDNTEVWESLKRSNGNIMSTIKGYRYMDAHWEPDGRRSTVTTVWSEDEDFDPNRFVGKGEQSPADPDVPACLGCERDFRVQSLGSDEPFQANMFESARGVESTYQFYRKAMIQRGWTERGVQPYLNTLGQHLDPVNEANSRGKILNMERGTESIQLAIFHSGSGVEVVTLHETAGAQNEIPELK